MIEKTADQKAREYESLHNRLFVVRMVVVLAVISLYLFSGASAQLAEGLRSRFDAWPLVNGFYFFITLFGFTVLMFPLSLYEDYTLEHRYGLSNQDFGEWSWDYAKSLLVEIVLGVIFFEAIYAMLRWWPDGWWIGATLFYVLFSVVLTTLAPVVIMPLFYELEPLDDKDLTQTISEYMEKAGLKVVGVFQWGLEESTNTANAALAGLGKTRRIILGDTMLEDYSKDEILAVLAHEVGHYKHRDTTRLMLVTALFSGVGFYIAHLCMEALLPAMNFSGLDDVGAFPVFVFCLFVFSTICMPAINAYSRRLEFAADAYAVRSMKTAEPLVGALEKLAAQNLADKEPAPWIEFLLYSHPSIQRRIQRARAVQL